MPSLGAWEAAGLVNRYDFMHCYRSCYLQNSFTLAIDIHLGVSCFLTSKLRGWHVHVSNYRIAAWTCTNFTVPIYYASCICAI